MSCLSYSAAEYVFEIDRKFIKNAGFCLLKPNSEVDNIILKNELTSHKQCWVLDFDIILKYVRLVKCWFFRYVVAAYVFSSNGIYA